MLSVCSICMYNNANILINFQRVTFLVILLQIWGYSIFDFGSSCTSHSRVVHYLRVFLDLQLLLKQLVTTVTRKVFAKFYFVYHCTHFQIGILQTVTHALCSSNNLTTAMHSICSPLENQLECQLIQLE